MKPEASELEQAREIADNWLRAKLGDTTDEVLIYGSIDLRDTLVDMIFAAQRAGAEAMRERVLTIVADQMKGRHELLVIFARQVEDAIRALPTDTDASY